MDQSGTATTSVDEGRAAITAAVRFLRTLPAHTSLVQEPDVAPLFAQLHELGRSVDAARVAVLAEATGRGLPGQAKRTGPVDDEGANDSDAAVGAGTSGSSWSGSAGGSTLAWVCELSPGLPVGDANRLVRLTRAATTERVHAPLLAALTSGRLDLRAADTCLSEMRQIQPLVRPEALDAVWEGMVQVSEDGDLRGIRSVRPAMIARYGEPDALQKLQDKASDRVGLSRPCETGDGTVAYRLITDLAGRAVIEAAIGPLSKPVPSEDGTPDPRPAEQRRAESLVAMLSRAVAAGERVPAHAKAQVIVQVEAADLSEAGRDRSFWFRRGGADPSSSPDAARASAGSCPAPGSTTGAGWTLGGLDFGALLGLETVRRLACDGEVTPVVLGELGEILHLGRTRRLFSSAQTKALWVRDLHCTYPGCHAAAHWCDAHHLQHWADGGPTDLTNAALLCGFHHSLVHRRRLAAVVEDDVGVTWDLRPGSYDRALRERRRHGDPSPPCAA